METVLLSVLVTVGIFGFLALVTVVADATIADYGERTVVINGGSRTVTVRGGMSLLAGLREAGVFIPSACGGRGSCGLCKVRLAERVGEPLPTEVPWLSPEEVAAGVRLSCQLKVKRDLAVLIPEELLSVREFEAEVTALTDLTYDIKGVTLRLVDPKEIVFRAGQFVQLKTPVYEKSSEEVYRAYSIASPPSRRNEIELEIRYVPNGICTTWVHRYLRVGDRVWFNGPYGEFYLRPSDRMVVCVAGGSGMAPIRSILWSMAEEGNARKTVYFFGARSRRDLFLVEEMRELERILPDFRFIPALSDPRPEDAWDGETGLVTEVLDRHLASGEGVEAYLCGSPAMIEACIKVLKAKGVPETLIFYDKFA